MSCIKCISEETKDFLLSISPEFSATIEKIDICDNDKEIEFDIDGKKKKRKPSAYNNFIGQCMKGTGKGIKDCAVDWRSKK